MSETGKSTILVVQDRATSALLGALLSDAGHQVIAMGSGEQALEQVTRQTVDLAIVESDLPGMDGYRLCRQLRQQETTHELAILMLSSRREIGDKVAGFEAGVDDYLSKPFESQELLYRLKILLARKQRRSEPTHPASSRGRIIALFGTKGGVGRTTIAVNLSVALQRTGQGRTVIFDGDFFFGDVALHLGLSPSHTILDLVNQIDSMDSELLEQVLIPHSSGVRVLLSPRDPEDVESISAQHVQRMLDSLTASFDYVVVDCQAIYDERTLGILERADAILLIIKPEVGCVKNMAVFSELAAKLRLSFDKKIHIVLNRAGSKTGIGPKEIERIFRRRIGFQIDSGGNAVVVSINRGVPLMIDQPHHPVSRQVEEIAHFLNRTLRPVQTPSDGQLVPGIAVPGQPSLRSVP